MYGPVPPHFRLLGHLWQQTDMEGRLRISVHPVVLGLQVRREADVELWAVAVDRVKDGHRQGSVDDLGRGHVRGGQGVDRVRGHLRHRVALPVNDVVDIAATETAGTVMIMSLK